MDLVFDGHGNAVHQWQILGGSISQPLCSFCVLFFGHDESLIEIFLCGKAEFSADLIASVSENVHKVYGSEFTVEKTLSQALDVKRNDSVYIKFAYLVAEVILLGIP